MKSYNEMKKGMARSQDAKRKTYAITRIQKDILTIRNQLDMVEGFIEEFINDKDKYLTEK